MHSALYVGRVRHRRVRAARATRSATGCSWPVLDLAELDTVFRGRWFWSARAPGAGVVSPRRLPRRSARCRSSDAVRDLVAERRPACGRRTDPPAHAPALLRARASTRSASTTASTPADTRVETIVAEITNTPWGERHATCLPSTRNAGRDSATRAPLSPRSFTSRRSSDGARLRLALRCSGQRRSRCTWSDCEDRHASSSTPR